MISSFTIYVGFVQFLAFSTIIWHSCADALSTEVGLNNLLFVWNIHAAFETMNTSLRQTSPLFEQYLNECCEVCHN